MRLTKEWSQWNEPRGASGQRARKVSGWSKRYKLAHGFLWEYSDKRLQLAQLLGQLGRFLSTAALSFSTMLGSSAAIRYKACQDEVCGRHRPKFVHPCDNTALALYWPWVPRTQWVFNYS
jgi:hypothetical protein